MITMTSLKAHMVTSFDLESALALALDRTLVLSCSGFQVGKALVIGKQPKD